MSELRRTEDTGLRTVVKGGCSGSGVRRVGPTSLRHYSSGLGVRPGVVSKRWRFNTCRLTRVDSGTYSYRESEPLDRSGGSRYEGGVPIESWTLTRYSPLPLYSRT